MINQTTIAPHPTCRRRGTFNLIEIAMAMAVVSLGLVSIMALFPVGFYRISSCFQVFLTPGPEKDLFLSFFLCFLNRKQFLCLL